MGAEALRFPRAVGLEERYVRLLPEVVLAVGPTELAAMAARALEPRPAPTIATAHLHQPRVSIREQAAVLVDRLRRSRSASFRALSADCPTTLHVVARFLALLELYRERVVAFEQLTPLGELTVRWTGSDVVPAELSLDEYDQSGQVALAERNGAG
jgi:segregation and condensation protein A